MKDILAKIKYYRELRGWSEYQLAERSGLPQSTISAWYQKQLSPSFSSLEKICIAFSTPMSQFFAESEDLVDLTEEQKDLLMKWNQLTEHQRSAIINLIVSILE